MLAQMSPVVYDQAPPEGPKIIRVVARWNDAGAAIVAPSAGSLGSSTFAINLQQQAQTNQFSSCQSVWIDNSTCPLQIQLTELETQQVIFVEPFSQSFYPVFASSNPTFSARAIYIAVQDSVTMANNAPNGSTRFFFMNVPCTPYVQLRNFTFNACFQNVIQSFTTIAAGGFIQPQLCVTLPEPAAVPTIDNLSNYSVVLQSASCSIANNGPGVMNGVLAYILYAAPASHLGALSLADGLYLDVLNDSDAAPAITWANGNGMFRTFDNPMVCSPGHSIFLGPVGTLPAGNTLQLNLNLNYSFVQIA